MGLLVVPGVDNLGQQGFLVLFEGAAPFHSFAGDAYGACEAAVDFQEKARFLKKANGGRAAIFREARMASSFMMIREENLDKSGTCVWGMYSWLQRFGL